MKTRISLIALILVLVTLQSAPVHNGSAIADSGAYEYGAAMKVFLPLVRRSLPDQIESIHY